MPEVMCEGRRWPVAEGDNLLDALLGAGVAVPWSCRAGVCQACLVRCLSGAPVETGTDAPEAALRAEGWRLACQCRVAGDLEVAVYDPRRQGLPATVDSLDWLSGDVLRLRLLPGRPLGYRPGQHLVLWTAEGVARPYSLASLPGEDPWLEFHLDCRQPGAFCALARRLAPGDRLWLGERHGGVLHYDPAWTDQPLWLLAGGTGLAPLWGVLREALRQGHAGPVRLVHVARAHYLAEPLQALAKQVPNLTLELVEGVALDDWLRTLRPPRQSIALLCGGPAFVEACGKRLFLAGLPRRQVLAEAYSTSSRQSNSPAGSAEDSQGRW